MNADNLAVKSMIGVLAILGGGWDLATRRIPNWLTFSVAAVALVYHATTDGWRGAGTSLIGLGLGIAILLPFYLLGGTGAGDVKMLGAAGAVVGPYALVSIFVYFAILGGIAALAVAIVHGRLREVLANTLSLLRKGPHRFETAAPRLAYGVVIGAGCLIYLWVGRISL